jgi:Holliday junction resolvase
MSSKQSQKGSRFEYKIRDMLTAKTGVKWDRVPMSGAGSMKGDLYCLTNHYYHCFECKSYADTVIKENLLSAKSNNLYMWWEQCTREAEQMNREPALVFKMDRGKPLIAIAEEIPELVSLTLSSDLGDIHMDVTMYLFEDWLEYKDIEDLVIV